jgi:putative tryptophan/tyrosine transport system substrate-binding protein
MRRRDFLTVVGGAAAGWPITGHAQQPGRMGRIGALMNTTADSPSAQADITAFTRGLQELGWTIGRNVRIDYRWSAADPDLLRKYAAELVALSPDVILAGAGATVGALQQASRTVPIVFVSTIDPVGGGWVESLARPGTNATGFEFYQFSIAGKWLALLKEIAPAVRRVVAIRDPSVAAGSAGFAALQTAAASADMEVTPVGVRDASEIERGVTAFAGAPNGGLIMVGPPYTIFQHRNMIAELAARYRLPAVYPVRYFTSIGGLLSYGPDVVDQYHRASGYVDRILKGEKPADLPVQAPTKYEMVINLKTAKALGLTVPQTLLVAADEVIE